MIEILAYIALGFLMIRLAVAISNVFSSIQLEDTIYQGKEKLSILIPARNEAHNLPALLEKLLLNTDNILEILIYDDASTDDTWEIIEKYRIQSELIRGIQGSGPPQGWLGKNHACHQLSIQARGDFLLFLDADVKPQPNLIPSLLNRIKKYHLSLLSVFPVQEMETRGEKLSVPLMNYILLSLLPMSLTRLSNRPSLSAANGQLMLFESKSYKENSWHEKLRDEAVEDIRIMQEMKKHGLHTETVLSGGQISCRMYSSYKDARKGFAKNIHHFFGRSYLLMAVFAFITTFGPIIIALAYGLNALIIYLLASLLLRAIISALSRQNILQQILLHPMLHLSMLDVMLYSWNTNRRGTLEWKGRKIDKTDR